MCLCVCVFLRVRARSCGVRASLPYFDTACSFSSAQYKGFCLYTYISCGKISLLAIAVPLKSIDKKKEKEEKYISAAAANINALALRQKCQVRRHSTNQALFSAVCIIK